MTKANIHTKLFFIKISFHILFSCATETPFYNTSTTTPQSNASLFTFYAFIPRLHKIINKKIHDQMSWTILLPLLTENDISLPVYIFDKLSSTSTIREQPSIPPKYQKPLQRQLHYCLPWRRSGSPSFPPGPGARYPSPHR